METRSRTTKLIIKNVEMLGTQKFDKFDKVIKWLDSLHDFEDFQHVKTSNENFTKFESSQASLDSESSVNTARYILSNRKNKQKTSTQCRSKIKKYRQSDGQFHQNSELIDLDNSGHKFKKMKLDNRQHLKYCSVTIQKMDVNEINYDGT